MSAAKIAVAVAALSLAACGVSQSTVRALEADNRAARAQLDTMKRSRAPLDEYAAALRGAPTGQASYVLVSPAEIEAQAKTFLPYALPARDLMSDATGRFVVLQVAGVRFLPRNRIAMGMFFRGEGVNINKKVPAAYKQDLERVKQSLAAGVWADVELVPVLHPELGIVQSHGTCTNLRLMANDTPTYRSEIQKYVNDKMFNVPFVLRIPALGGVPADPVFVTQNHVVVHYRR